MKGSPEEKSLEETLDHCQKRRKQLKITTTMLDYPLGCTNVPTDQSVSLKTLTKS